MVLETSGKALFDALALRRSIRTISGTSPKLSLRGHEILLMFLLRPACGNMSVLRAGASTRCRRGVDAPGDAGSRIMPFGALAERPRRPRSSDAVRGLQADTQPWSRSKHADDRYGALRDLVVAGALTRYALRLEAGAALSQSADLGPPRSAAPARSPWRSNACHVAVHDCDQLVALP